MTVQKVRTQKTYRDDKKITPAPKSRGNNQVTFNFSLSACWSTAEKLMCCASVKETVTKKVGLLIVGDNGSADWRFGNYGGKVKKAMEMQEKGIDIKILGESEFYEKLKEINT